MTINTCKRCGKSFESNGKKAFCEDCRTGTCAICGKSFDRVGGSASREFCSRECAAKYKKQTGYAKEITKKAQQTRLERYGSLRSDIFHEYRRTCKYCGKEFTTTSPKQIYCDGPHYGQCPICGKPSLIVDLSLPVPTCSEECRQEKIRRTTRDRFGEACVFQTEYQKQKSKQTCLEKYGVEYYSQTQEFKDKMSEIIPTTYRESDLQRKRTNEVKYGVPYPTMNSDVKQKARATFDARYEGVGFGSPALLKQIKSTNLSKYGVENPMQNKEIRAKAEETCWIRHGYKHYVGSFENIQQVIQDPSKFEIYQEFRKDVESFIKEHFDYKPTLTQVAQLIGCDPSTVSLHILRNNLQHLIEYRISTVEVELRDFLTTYLPEDQVLIHNRTTITPLELDFYLPEYHLGIECNPTYTHNSSRCTYYDDDQESVAIPANYHQTKTLQCEEKGVRLIHVFGYQWTWKSDIVKSMILNAIGKTPVTYFARKCEIQPVSDTDSRVFLNENHIQGYTTSKVRLGLYSDGVLVSLMTFSRKRGTMGHTKGDTEHDWELTRFCNRKYTRCVGGASKLFKYFVQHYHPNSVVSFSDRSSTSGGLYSILGFQFDSYTGLNYVWVDHKTDYYYNRVACQKSNLRKLFRDPEIDIEHKTESQIMEEHGFVKVYGSGLIKWIWTPNTSLAQFG